MKIYPVFALNLLYKDKNNPLPGQVHKLEPSLQIIDDYEQEVNELLAVKKTRNQLSYYINQLGHNEDSEQYPASDFKYAPYKLKAFYFYYLELPGPL